MYEVIKYIDYITCSVTQFMTADDVFGRWQDTHPRQRNYNCAKVFDIGIIVQWHDKNPKMKISITLSGETLSKMRDVGFTDYAILKWLSSMPNCKYSRIDVQVTSRRKDGNPHEFTPHTINHLAANGLCKTKLKPDNPVATPHLEVQTAYIGSRKSRNRLFRAYDKGVELGGIAGQIIRYELETRKNATHIARELEIHQTDIASLIRRYVDFPNVDKWVEIMGADVAENWRIDEYESVSDKNKKRWQWLFDSVAPAMARALFYDDVHVSDNKNADIFAAMVASHYNSLIDSD